MSLDSYVTLGRSGLWVSPFTLGTMTFGEDWGWGSSPEESARILASYVDRGGNSIDTANVYTNGHSSAGSTSVDTARGRTPSAADLVVIDAVNAVAEEIGVPAAQVALAWLSGRPGVSCIVIGARRLDQFETNLGALDVTLTDVQRAALDDVSAPKLNFPAENNRSLAPSTQFAGATVDGRASAVLPMLHTSSVRY